jgi:ribosomal protein S18 acetylase RimI-like enzyme
VENNMVITAMTMADYNQVIELWSATAGIGLSDADSKENIEIFLQRNEGLSFVAKSGSQIIGAVLAGHDGRRGYLHHLCVSPAYQRHGIGSALVENCLGKLKEQGIRKCHLFVFTNNRQGILFWNKIRFNRREELYLLSRNLDDINN